MKIVQTLTVDTVRECLPRYVSELARSLANEATDDMAGEVHDGGVYALARWFDALLAFSPANPTEDVGGRQDG
jgi:hypothetical protein